MIDEHSTNQRNEEKGPVSLSVFRVTDGIRHSREIHSPPTFLQLEQVKFNEVDWGVIRRIYKHLTNWFLGSALWSLADSSSMLGHIEPHLQASTVLKRRSRPGSHRRYG